MADESCRFCQIVAGVLTAARVLEDDSCLAFLDVRPLFPGHCLLVPREHYETLADLPVRLIGPIFADAQRLASAVEQAMDAEGTFVAINNRVSQSVPHLHIHIVPRRRKDALKGFFWPRGKYESDAAMRQTAEAIKAALG